MVLFFVRNILTLRLPDSDLPEYIIGGLTCFIILVSLLGNTLVLVAIAKTKTLQRMSVAWYISLAVADLARTIFCMPIFVALLFSPNWSLPSDICSTLQCFQISLQVVSIFNLTAISLDRVFMITRPLTYQRTVNVSKIVGLILLIWIVGFCLGFLQLIWWENGPSSGLKALLVRLRGKSNLDCEYNAPFSIVMLNVTVGFIAPMIVMIVVYTKIFWVVHSQMRKIKRRLSEIWDVGSDGSKNKAEQYTQIPAITKSADSMRASTSEERLRYSSVSMPSKASGAVVQSELARITEVPHENCSSPLHCKECRERSSSDNSSTKASPPMQFPREASDLSVIDLSQGINETETETETEPHVQSKGKNQSKANIKDEKTAMNKQSVSDQTSNAQRSNTKNTNNNAKSSATSENKAQAEVSNPTVSKDTNSNLTKGVLSTTPQVQSTVPPPQGERRSSLKKARLPGDDSPVATKRRASVQFQLYLDEHKDSSEDQNGHPHSKVHKKLRPGVVLDSDLASSQSTSSQSNSKRSDSKNTNTKGSKPPPKVHKKLRSGVVLDEDTTTTSEAVTASTAETWLSGSTGQRQPSRPTRQVSEEHTQIWASRHFNDGQEFSYTSGTGCGAPSSQVQSSQIHGNHHHHQQQNEHETQAQTSSSDDSCQPRRSIGNESTTGSTHQSLSSMIQRRRRSIQRFRENKAVKMTLVVVGAFVLCWLPYEVVTVVRQFTDVSACTWQAVIMIAYSASAINPFIYNFYSSEFRKSTKRALCCDDNVVTPWM